MLPGSVTTSSPAYLGAISEFVGGQVDLAEGALADEAAEGVVADRLEVFTRELAGTHSVSLGRAADRTDGHTLVVLGTKERAARVSRQPGPVLANRERGEDERSNERTLALRPSASAFPFAVCIPPRPRAGAVPAPGCRCRRVTCAMLVSLAPRSPGDLIGQGREVVGRRCSLRDRRCRRRS